MQKLVFVEFEPAVQFVPRLNEHGKLLKNAEGDPIKDARHFHNQLGRPVSFEPAKWEAILHGRVMHWELDNDKDPNIMDLRQRIKLCWQAGAEHPTSLNLMVELDEDHNDFPYIQDIMSKIFLGSVNIGIAEDTEIVFEPAGAKILPFSPRRAA